MFPKAPDEIRGIYTSANSPLICRSVIPGSGNAPTQSKVRNASWYSSRKQKYGPHGSYFCFLFCGCRWETS